MEKVEFICKLLDDKKAKDIVTVNLENLTIIADCFIICSARSNTQVKALADIVEEGMSKVGVEPLRVEGKQEGRWAVLDYGDVIVHIFYEETRRLYSLETLWSNGANVTHYGEEESVDGFKRIDDGKPV
ncbi:MAG: ribosome silencing factor [Clostridia bacterium]|nr:ribosome silencing factor [Clostridia bacterium]